MFNKIVACAKKCLETGNFRWSLKLTDINPVHDKDNSQDKSYYRFINILPFL